MNLFTWKWGTESRSTWDLMSCYAPQVDWLQTEEGEIDKEVELFCTCYLEDHSPQRRFDRRICLFIITTLPNGSKWTIVEEATEEPKEGEYHWEIIWRDFKLHIQSLDIKLSAPIWRQLYGSLMSQEGWHCQQNHDRSIKLIHFWWSANWRRRGGNEERRRRIVEHP